MDAKQPLQKLYNTKNPLTRISKLEARTTIKPTQPLGALGEVTELTGDLIVDRLLLPSTSALDLEPSSTDFTGVFATGDGVSFDNYPDAPVAIGGAKDGVVKAGLDNQGNLFGAGGKFKVDEDKVTASAIFIEDGSNFDFNNAGLYSSTSTWTAYTVASGATVNAIKWIDDLDLWIAVGTSDDIWYSTDAQTWNAASLTGAGAYKVSYQDIAYSTDLGRIVAVGAVTGSTDHTAASAYSTDGMNWTRGATPDVSASSVTWRNVEYSVDQGLFVAVKSTPLGSANNVMTSTDGITFTARTAGTSTDLWGGIAYSSDLGLWVTMGYTTDSPISATSSDAITWAVSSDLNTAMAQWDVDYSPEFGKFVAVGACGGYSYNETVKSSTSGLTWTNETSQPSDIGIDYYFIKWVNELKRLVGGGRGTGGGGAGLILWSSNGTDYLAETSSDLSTQVISLDFNPKTGEMVAVAGNSSVYVAIFAGDFFVVSDGLEKKISFSPAGYLINGKIQTAISGTSLVVDILNANGSSPDSRNPIYTNINGTNYTITGALTATLAGGTAAPIFNLNSAELTGKSCDLFVYTYYNSAWNMVDFGIARVPYLRFCGDASTDSSSEKFFQAGVVKPTLETPAATDPCQLVGRFSATWSSSDWTSTSDVINYPIYETSWLDWTPTASAGGSMTYTSVSFTRAQYRVGNKKMEISVIGSGTTGGTANPNLLITLPLTVLASQNVGASVGDTNSIAGIAFVNTTTQLGFRKYDNSNFGLGASRQLSANTFFLI